MTTHSLERYNVKIDTYFGIGRSHEVNQDYALSGNIPFPWVVVADGCSSSHHTDMGARLLAWSANRCLVDHSDALFFGEPDDDHESSLGNCIILRAKRALDILGQPEQGTSSVLDATFMLAFVMDERVVIHAFGDGVIALGRKDGSVSVLEIDYSHNAPLYLSYRLDQGRAELWRKFSDTEFKYLRQQGFEVSVDKYKGLTLSYNTSDLSWVLLGTDGLQTFMESQIKGAISAREIVAALTDFKNTNGDYLKRRVKRQLNSWAKQGIVHEDDIGLGCLLFEES